MRTEHGITRTIYVRPRDRAMWLKVIEKARREKISVSEAMVEAIRKWVEDEPASG